jgi:AraC-like DNA-binding protein
LDYIASANSARTFAMATAKRKENATDITSGWPLPVNGVRILIPQFLTKLLSEHPLSRDLHPLAAGLYPNAAGHHMRRRRHTNNLIVYCTAGRGSLRTDGGLWPVTAGDLMLLPAGTAHAYSADRDQPWTVYWVHYEGELGDAYTRFLGSAQPLVHIGVQPRLIADFEALFALRGAGYAERVFVHAACQLKAMLTRVANLIAARGTPRGTHIDLDQIRQLMYLRLDGELSLDDLAQAANLSKFHFARKFRQLTGHAPIQHFIHLKMQHACQLLDTTHEPVKRVANRVGYDDPQYFSRLFKRVIGVSPQQYRLHRLA